MSLYPVTLEQTIDRIIRRDCPPCGVGIGYAQSPCMRAKMRDVLNMVSFLIRTRGVIILNVPVLTFVPNQGRTDTTILEAAIIARWPDLVYQLLLLGANPNVNTAGVPLVTQLRQAQLDYGPPGEDAIEQVIINYLIQFGAYPY